MRDPLALCQVSHTFVLPHARLRQRFPAPEVTNGQGAARLGRPSTPAMAAGWTDHGWTRKEVLFYRVPPWPQPQTVESRIRGEDRSVVRLGGLRCRPSGASEGLKTGWEGL